MRKPTCLFFGVMKYYLEKDTSWKVGNSDVSFIVLQDLMKSFITSSNE